MATPSEKRFYQLTLAIQKAINAIEVPVKEKHVRSTIIGTFQEQSATTYWMVAIRLPLQDNRIVAWKFCHVTHKLLREGHPACLDDSQRHVTMIENLGKLWVHLREGYGKLVHLYCNLLVCKLKFHARNPRFPGNMMLSSDELDAIAENDVNNYFQICVELFDYMDDILNLQEAVFDSLGNARANSMTASGQCRLAALIPCAQDASHIYDCSVRLLFRLHAALPPDVAAGHRDRFRQQFKKLSSFYKHASSLQYYRNLLTLPVLPPNPPNFLLQSDFGTYVTPVVSIPEPPPDEPDSVASLIDTTDTMSHATSPDHSETFDTRATPSPQPDPIVERDRLIEHLQHELKRMRSEMSEMNQQRNAMLRTMRENVTVMESQLHATKNELEQEKHKSEDASAQLPQVIQKLAATEDRAKGLEEKFQKLKTAYTQLREEHIPLIRQKAEADKMVATLKAEAARHESSVKGLEQQLNDRAKDVELLQQSASSSEEIEAYKTEIANLRNDLEQSRLKDAELETLRASLAALEIEHNTVKTEQEDKVTTLTNELKETAEALERLQQEKLDKENELSRVKEELVGLREKSGDEYNKVLKERNEALNQVMDLKQTYQQEKEAHEQITNKLQDDINKLKLKIGDSEMEFSNEFKMMKQNFEIEQQHFEDVLAQKDVEINDALHKLETLQSEIDNINSNFESKNQSNAKEINDLHAKIIELTLKEEENVSKIQQFEFEKEKLRDTIAGLENERNSLTSLISEKETVVQECNIRIKELKDKEYKIKELFHDLEKQAEEKSELIDKLNIEKENLTKTVTELKDGLSEKNREMKDLRLQINSTNSLLEKQKIQFELKLEENNCEIAILNDKLQNTSDSKNEIVDNLKSVIAEKDKLIYSLTVDKESMSAEIFNLKEELNETQAELEIGKNEFLTVSEEHDRFIEQNVNNLSLKNEKLRSLQQEVLELTKEKEDFANEKQELTKAYASEKQVLQNTIEESRRNERKLQIEIENILKEKDDLMNQLNSKIDELNSANKKNKECNDREVISLCNKLESKDLKISERDNAIVQAQKTILELQSKLEELENNIVNTNENIAKKDKDFQLLEARLEHTDSERLNAESELQDLLQHNTVLEADLLAVKKQLEDAQKLLEKERLKLVTCAGDAAVEVANNALSALERASAHDTSRTAAELAAKALEDLTKISEVKGNEESVARSAIFAAHNAAQLSTYVTEISNASTDMALADKLNNECRTMLTSTKQCLEYLKSGAIQGHAEAAGHVKGLAEAAAAADRSSGVARTVDDELADMDRAIEEAASQIEVLLQASRSGDSGVKLEVNEKILDACTTLMGAVKILVQDARRLQNELGDPTTRLKMYRRNPQWSQGLISAAKAVVFAAKLLVTSADEAVATNRVEGVSAAAHEVAGSTAQLVAASRARAPPASPALAALTSASRDVAAATGAVVAAVRAASALVTEQEALDTSSLTLTATRRLEMESKVRSLSLEAALEAERGRLAALRRRHYQLAQAQENGNMTNGQD